MHRICGRQSAKYRFRGRFYGESDQVDCVGNPELSCRGTTSSNPSPSRRESANHLSAPFAWCAPMSLVAADGIPRGIWCKSHGCAGNFRDIRGTRLPPGPQWMTNAGAASEHRKFTSPTPVPPLPVTGLPLGQQSARQCQEHPRGHSCGWRQASPALPRRLRLALQPPLRIENIQERLALAATPPRRCPYRLLTLAEARR